MFQNSFPVVGTMTQSRFAYFTFHLLTFSSVVKLHATPVTESCRFHTDAYKQYANLIARGQGTVPIHNLTCTCFVSTPQISILYPAADDSPDPDIEISSYDCQGVAWPCGEMPQTCAGIQENVFSYRSVSGIFNKTAVITCKSARNSNKADPFIVWVEPAVTSIPSSSDTTSSFTMTTTTTTTIITTFSKVSSSPEMSKSIDYSTSVSPMTTAVTSQPPTETLSTQHASSATPSPSTTPPTSLSLSATYTFITTSTYAASASANNDCTVTVSTCILDPDVGRITAPTVVPTDNPIAAVVAAALVVVALMIIIFVLLIVLIVVLKKRQKQVEKDYKTPPPNSELQESIMLKNNATK